ncbi:hypothetical protein HNY73_007684 [Argiope bruennichi]|uniref:Uncharacterized protein n=1 Tax=Argiope bruennichi TaxID=94029 RepID=A0A8T0FFM7_ARGBR|nr:hypothetical protein HNY73_007684 [Argiope bruennichi]
MEEIEDFEEFYYENEDYMKPPQKLEDLMNQEKHNIKTKVIDVGDNCIEIIRFPDLPEIAMGFDLNSLHLMSLQDLAMRRLAVQLCCHRKMLAYTVKKDSETRRQKEHEIRMYGLLKNLLPEVPLPPSMKHELFSLMKSVSREIIKWLDLHENYLGPCNLNEMENLVQLCWTSLGNVDYRETVAALIRQEKLDVTQRYNLACLYCLEEDIRELWRKMPEKSKNSYYDANPANIKQPDLVIIWTFILKGKIDNFLRYLEEKGNSHPSINHFGFESAATGGYRTAAQYFYEKLTFEEREKVLMKTAMSVASLRSNDYYFYMEERQQLGDVLFYLMSVMQPYEQKILLWYYPCETLKCVLDWPRQDAFIELAKSAYPFLSLDAYIRVLFNLSRNNSSGYNYSKLFQEFFMLGPFDFNLEMTYYKYILLDFFQSYDMETVKFILKHLEAQGIIDPILDSTSSFTHYELCKPCEWDLMKFFIEEVKLYESERRRNAKLLSESRRLHPEKKENQRLIDVKNNSDLEIQEKEINEPMAVKKLLMPLKAVYDNFINFLFQ